MFYQGTNTVDLFAEIVHTRAEDSSSHFYSVGITVEDRLHGNGVAVSDAERAHVELVDIEHCIFAACLAVHAHGLLVGVAREATGIAQQRLQALVTLHLIIHGSFHLARDVHQTVVGSHDDDVAVVQPHVARHLPVEDVVVDVADRDEAVVSVNLYVAQRAYVVGAAGHVEGVEHRGECRQGVGARLHDLAHDIDRHRPRLSERQVDAARLVARAERGAQPCLGRRHGESSHAYGAVALDHDVAVGRHGAVHRLLRRAIDVHRHLVAGAEHVVLWRGNVHQRLKR